MDNTYSERELTEKYMSGICASEGCGTSLIFNQNNRSIECITCGQMHEVDKLRDVQLVNNPSVIVEDYIRKILMQESGKAVKGADIAKYMGLSNYECKLLAPFLTYYGKDKATGKAKLLKDMAKKTKQGTFDCTVLSSMAFRISSDALNMLGYGRDRTGSVDYLKDVLCAINQATGASQNSTPSGECTDYLIPIHADGDGHCLVHAVSRALVGRELFWHALRTELKSHLMERADDYRALLKDFMVVEDGEWEDIVAECDADFVPKDGDTMGLRNVHIFGLANVLRRPIILLDSLSGIQSSADYSGLFLPGLCDVSECKSKQGQLNKPICLAWSSQGHNHFIALVGIKERTPPRIPSTMMPKVWALPQEQRDIYLQHETDMTFIIGGDKGLSEEYFIQLAKCMEELFYEEHGVVPSIVAEIHHNYYRHSGIIGSTHTLVLQEAAKAVKQRRLYTCLYCHSVLLHTILPDSYRRGGDMYNIAYQEHQGLRKNVIYTFNDFGVQCRYDEVHDELVPQYENCRMQKCSFCQSVKLRQMRGDGTIMYNNGDRTRTPAPKHKCLCGFKHYYNGKEYDCEPVKLPVILSWGNTVVNETVEWFQDQSDASLNSNAFDLAQAVVQKHYPGQFGSERLVQSVAEQIFLLTSKFTHEDPPPTYAESQREAAEAAGGGRSADAQRHGQGGKGTDDGGSRTAAQAMDVDDGTKFYSHQASKIILTGPNRKTLHREELTKSESEKRVAERVKENAKLYQRRRNQDLDTNGDIQAKTAKKQSANSVSSSTKTTASATTTTAQGTSSSSTNSSSSSPSTASGSTCKVKVMASNSKQLLLTLDAGTTFVQLRERLALELGVTVQQVQTIKYGFPPKLLTPKQDESEVVPLCNGDRINVDIDLSPALDVRKPTRVPDGVLPAVSVTNTRWSGFTDVAHEPDDKALLEKISKLQGSGSSNIELSIASLEILAAISGTSLWHYVQRMPHLFSVGGLFYEQVKQDVGLVDGKHIQLPNLPGKVFMYNAGLNRLELCLEPKGHFAISPGVEDKVQAGPDWAAVARAKDAQREKQQCDARIASLPTSSTTDNLPSMLPFSGAGHTIGSSLSATGSNTNRSPGGPRSHMATESHMPSDLLPTSHHRNSGKHHGSPGQKSLSPAKATSINSPLGNRLSDNVILEDTEETIMDDADGSTTKTISATQSPPVFKPQLRVGPGFSMLSNETDRPANVTIIRGLPTVTELSDGEDEETPDVEEQEAAPCASAHNVSAHDVSTHDTSSHIVTQDVNTHDTNSHDSSTHHVSMHDVSAHDFSSHDISTQDVSAQDISKQDVSSHGVNTQDVSAQNVADSVEGTCATTNGISDMEVDPTATQTASSEATTTKDD